MRDERIRSSVERHVVVRLVEENEDELFRLDRGVLCSLFNIQQSSCTGLWQW